MEGGEEGYRYTLGSNERLYVLSMCMNSRDQQGSYALVVNRQGPSEKEITKEAVYGECMNQLRELADRGILPEMVRDVTEDSYQAVLNILKAHHIRATFFLIGESVEKHPEVAKRIAEEGHTIGIHCYNHDYDKLYQSTETYLADFEKAKSAIYEAAGVEATIFRFPGGSINAHNKAVYKEIIREMEDRGYVYFDWNASLEDASKHNEPERLIQNATESTLGRRKVVMLAHDVVYNTTVCLEELLDQLPEYQMLPITPEVEPIQF